jgi:tetratricopeptide (TPR) repeat protein
MNVQPRLALLLASLAPAFLGGCAIDNGSGPEGSGGCGGGCGSGCAPASATPAAASDASASSADASAMTIDGVNPANINDVDKSERFAAAVKGLSFEGERLSVLPAHAVKRNPGASAEFLRLGRAAYDANERDVATLQFANAFRADDRNADAAYWLAKAFALRGKTEQRIASARTATELAPESAEARYELGMALWTRGDLSQGDTIAATWAFLDALSVNPAHGPSLERLAVASYYEGDAAAARQYAARAKAAGQTVPAQLEAMLTQMP